MSDFVQQIKPLIHWLHIHPHWVGVVTFFITFLECLAVVGLLIPGTAIMTAIGALIGASIVSFKIVFPAAILGAVLGDTLSFWIGFKQREHLREIWPFKNYPKLLQKGESFFYQHGGKGIFAARFLGPIRPMLPIIAGMLNLSPLRFIFADIISAIFWAPIYMLPGIILGAASIELAPGVAWHLILYVILALFVLWSISWAIQRAITWFFNAIHRLLDQMWLAIKHKALLRPLHIALQDPLHPESHAQLTLGLYFVFTSFLFYLVASSVWHHGALTNWNVPILYLLKSVHNNFLDHLMLAFTMIGAPLVMAIIFVAVWCWLVWQRDWRTTRHWSVLGVFAFGGTEVIKHVVHAVRPSGLLVTPSGYSFPSGHTTLSVAVLGFVAVLLARNLKPNQRWVPFLLAVLIAAIIGVSRLYLGAHWLTDVIGGILLATSIVMLVTLSYRRKITPDVHPWKLLSVVLVSWFCAALVYSVLHYKKDLMNYTSYIPARTLSMQTWWTRTGAAEPLFRLNRLGKPVQLLNLQWAGNLADIEKNLVARGWETSPTSATKTILNHLSKQNKILPLPLLPQLYLDQHPVLVMTKPLADSQDLLVLSLWDAKTTFADSRLPLWLGTINYYAAAPSKGLFHLHPERYTLPDVPALRLLEKELIDFSWKTEDFSAQQQVLLIKPH